MTRFNILIEEGIDMVLHALEHAWGGEIFIPKIPSYRITDVATAIDENCKQEIIGVRPGEKIHEEMITSSDSYTTYDLGKYFTILPLKTLWSLEEFIKKFKAEKVIENFVYNSGQNEEFLTVSQIRDLIKNNNL